MQTIDQQNCWRAGRHRSSLRKAADVTNDCCADARAGVIWRRPAWSDAFAPHPGEFVMLRVVAIALAGALSITAGHAADVKVLAALAVQDALGPLALRFWRERGHTILIDYSTVGAIRKRLAGGERADGVVVASEAADE